MGQPGLELLIESKFYDTGLKEARDRIAHDCLLIDTDLSRQDVTPEFINPFVRDSLEAADFIAENCVALLTSKRLKGESGGGSTQQKTK